MPRPIISKLFAVIGNPLAQSYSKTYWNDIFKEKGMTSHFYDAKELRTIKELPSFLNANHNLHGFNVTIPFKESVIEYLDNVDPVAKEIGAVNTVKVSWVDGKPVLTGYNTDWIGFKNSLEPMLKPSDKKALVLGTGGASKSIVFALKRMGIDVTLVSRTQEGALRYEDITDNVIKEHTIIINATPVGSFPAVTKCPDIPYESITPNHVVYDVIYNPIRTLFLQQAELKGASIKNGWEMFTGQAKEAWKIFINEK
ncbi:MAG: shikimate dehydrogenase [Paludibacteraceae bacterium]|nr:shikimate dehydrogenase [Paludibacteraceae bacterium]